jgi:hypothetical protein
MEDATIIDLLDRNDCVIGTMPIQRAYRMGLKNIRSVILFMANCCGQIFVEQNLSQHESLEINLDANSWQFSQKVTVKAGESYQQALMRALRHNKNLDIQQEDVSMLGIVNPFLHPVSSFYGVFRTTSVFKGSFSQDSTNKSTQHLWLTPSEAVSNYKQSAADPTQDLPYLISLFESDLSPAHMQLCLEKRELRRCSH